MNLFYLLSVVGTRFLNLLSIIILSYLLSSSDFGRYSLVVTNGLFLHIVFTSWITSCLWRDASQVEQKELSGVIGFSLHLVARLALPLVASGLLCMAIVRSESRIYGFVPILAAANLLCELVSVVLNARHEDRTYSLISLLRGANSFFLSVCCIVLGFGIVGVLVSQLIGMLSTLLFVPTARNVLLCYRSRTAAEIPLIPMMAFGLNSAIALNLYLIVNALCRNVIAYRLDEESAGYFSIASDMFYAPIALVATSLSLSNIPLLYRSSLEKGEKELSNSKENISFRFILTILAVAFPYALGGWFVAPEIAQMLLSTHAGGQVSIVAFAGAIQGSCFAVISTKTTIELTRGETRKSLFFSIFALILACVFLAMAGSTLISLSTAATIALLITSVVCIYDTCSLPGKHNPILGIIKIAIASMSMLPGLLLTDALLTGARMVVVAVPLSIAIYLFVGFLLRSDAIRSLYRFDRAKSRITI